jgi:excinuclease UvrABC nuclease subunit
MSIESNNRIIEVNFGNEFVTKADQVPDQSGIYAICRGKKENGNWIVSEVLYIGEAANMRERLTQGHEKLPRCFVHASFLGEQLMFFSALIPNHSNRELAEKAFIWKMTPRFNDRIDCPIADHVIIKTISHLDIPSIIIVSSHE